MLWGLRDVSYLCDVLIFLVMIGVVCVGLYVYDEFMSVTSSASALKNLFIRLKMPAAVVKILPILASSVT